jgi:hypothetical protein
MTDNSKAIAIIDSSNDPDQLRRFIENAQRMNFPEVREAAFRRLVEIMPDEEPGTVEHDFWRSIHALEEVLREERGKTVRLSRTRQKIARVGVMQTLSDLATSKTPAKGFEMLLERNMPELTGEAVVLRHKDLFDTDVVAAARTRLEVAGVDADQLPAK